MSRTIDLTRRLRQWDAGQTTYLIRPDLSVLPNWARVSALMEDLAREVLQGLEDGTRDKGQDPVIVTVKVDVETGLYVSDQKPAKARAQKRRKG